MNFRQVHLDFHTSEEIKNTAILNISSINIFSLQIIYLQFSQNFEIH